MTRRRDVLRYLGLSGTLAALLGKTAQAEEAAASSGVRAPRSARAPLRNRTASIPFTLYGRTGRVAVAYGVTEDPAAVGFDIVPKLGLAMSACKGYPTMHAVIEGYEGAGYRTLCGWIQVVTGRYYRTIGEDAAPAETSISVDKLPSMEDVDVPFASFGFLPEVFDAPCGNLNGFAHLRWTADTFLTTVPLRSRTEPIQRLAGFRWGYCNYEASAHRPVSALPLEVTGAGAWNALLPLLTKTFSGWRFAATT